jgi:hypothetical protein
MIYKFIKEYVDLQNENTFTITHTSKKLIFIYIRYNLIIF